MTAGVRLGRGFGPMLTSRLAAPTDDGMLARLEQWAADLLASIEQDGWPLFRTAEVWRYQIGLGGAGEQSFDRYAPFTFVKVEAIAPRREGDYDLNCRLRLVVAFGTTGEADGDARRWLTAAADRVRMALEAAHPGEAFDCDEFYLTAGPLESVEHPKRCAMEMHFEAQWIVAPGD